MIPALVVPVLNRPDLLRRLLASIDCPVADVLIIDNGGVMRGTPAVPSAERVHLLPMPSNLGVPSSWNLGVKALPFAPWWLFVNSDAFFPSGALAAMAAAARRDALVLSAGNPPWCCFALGDQVVNRVGLFDEKIHPAYFEDNDYERRCQHHGVPVVHSSVEVRHDNSSTIGSDPALAHANGRTFMMNAAYYGEKVARDDFTEGRWDLWRRRELSWD